MCTSTLDILERTCCVALGERYPVALMRLSRLLKKSAAKRFGL
jgi:hypothetical protein